MIPKIIHTIWFQGDDIPHNYRENIEKLRIINHDWLYFHWKGDDLRKNCYSVGDNIGKLYDSYKYMHQKIDLGRLATLYIFGGITVDVDVTPLKSFNETPGLGDSELIISKSSRKKSEIWLFSGGRLCSACNNAIILAESNSPKLKKIIDILVKSGSGRHFLKYWRVQWSTGPFAFSTALYKILSEDANCKIKILPNCYFESTQYHPKLPSNAIIIHHHDNTWLPCWFKISKTILVKIIGVFG